MTHNKIYLTTTLPYANSIPHIGHALEFIQGDTIARYLRFKDNDVFFNIGLDEHGTKIYDAAKKLNIETQEYVNELAVSWKEFCLKFNISYDNFYRTTSESHKNSVQETWSKLFLKGDIYKKKYEGLYCVGCESFKTSKDLIDGKCPDHLTTEIKRIEEENYFFKLSNYKEHLLGWIKNNNEFLQPNNKLNELINLIEDIEDISVSRLKENSPWGVPVPNDDTQVIYVWFDALLNYTISCNDEERWKNSIQICGPDNLRFQAVIWQGILAALNITQTNKLLVHGTVLDSSGAKMSKSVGNVIDPIDQLNKFGLTAVRYYALAGINTYSNASWSEQELIDLHNSHLADDYGNLIARVLHLIDKFEIEIKDNNFDKGFGETYQSKFILVHKLLDNFLLKDALTELNNIVKNANKYITEKEPWKNENNRVQVLNNLHWLLNVVTDIYSNFIPEITNEIKTILSNKKKEIIFKKL